MHCAAACPKKAVLWNDQPAALEKSLPKIPDDFSETLEGYLQTVRSYRNFKPVPVEKELLKHVLELSVWSPSAKNQHPTNWIVINDEAKLLTIMNLILAYVKESGNSLEIADEYEKGNNVVMGSAKTVVIAHARTNAINPAVDTAIAMQNITLMLNAHGVGSCWAGYLTRLSNVIPEIRELIGVPEGHQIFGAMMAGYPDGERYLSVPVRVKEPKISWQ
jgi:nitroreductase